MAVHGKCLALSSSGVGVPQQALIAWHHKHSHLSVH
jgi:hypothetical protein